MLLSRGSTRGAVALSFIVRLRVPVLYALPYSPGAKAGREEREERTRRLMVLSSLWGVRGQAPVP